MPLRCLLDCKRNRKKEAQDNKQTTPPDAEEKKLRAGNEEIETGDDMHTELGIVITKTFTCAPVFRTSESIQYDTRAVVLTYPAYKIRAGFKGSISSQASQPVTVNLSELAQTDLAATPSPATDVKQFTFQKST